MEGLLSAGPTLSSFSSSEQCQPMPTRPNKCLKVPTSLTCTKKCKKVPKNPPKFQKVPVLLSAHVKRFSFSCMRDFIKTLFEFQQQNYSEGFSDIYHDNVILSCFWNWTKPDIEHWHLHPLSLSALHHCTEIFSVQCRVCSVQCRVCSVQCRVCSVQCRLRSVQCRVCSAIHPGFARCNYGTSHSTPLLA